MILPCRQCSYETPEELLYCTKCRTRLIPRNKYDLEFRDFVYPPDLDAIENLKVVGFLPYLLKRFTYGNFEKDLFSELSTRALRAEPESDLDLMVRRCASMLSLDALPEVFVTNSHEPNAFTFGSDGRAYVVVSSALFKSLTVEELMMVLGHEFGHVKGGHILYHVLAEVLAGGIGMSASLLGVGAITIPLRLALLSWHRESEVTADRASLLVTNNITIMHTLFSKLTQRVGGTALNQGEYGRREAGMLESFGELYRTHPLDSKRFTLAKDFSQSREYGDARRKIEQRQSLLRALIPICRFCGERKLSEELFCQDCGRCQT